ncbi:MAG: succinate dehydrogenase cytochrome b subunit [Planctomycetes bacterium]|nr:succinate dehydrogenase cytochrome b subunit [Planctomycetota bacterium]
MSWLFDFWRSSIGGKVTMAVTGVLLFGFVVAHLLGNLQLLAGPDAINAYAKWLHDRGALLWVARGGLLVVFLLHVATAVRLSRANKQARPVPYASEATVQATFASRSMVFSGLTLLVFVVYHLLHFTFGVTNPGDFARKGNGAGGFDVHAMVTHSFSVPAIAVVYAAAQIVLFLHLRHGLRSFAQTLGLCHRRYTPIVERLATVLAALIAAGNAFLALSVLAGIVKVAQ